MTPAIEAGVSSNEDSCNKHDMDYRTCVEMPNKQHLLKVLEQFPTAPEMTIADATQTFDFLFREDYPLKCLFHKGKSGGPKMTDVGHHFESLAFAPGSWLDRRVKKHLVDNGAEYLIHPQLRNNAFFAYSELLNEYNGSACCIPQERFHALFPPSGLVSPGSS